MAVKVAINGFGRIGRNVLLMLGLTLLLFAQRLFDALAQFRQPLPFGGVQIRQRGAGVQIGRGLVNQDRIG